MRTVFEDPFDREAVSPPMQEAPGVGCVGVEFGPLSYLVVQPEHPRVVGREDRLPLVPYPVEIERVAVGCHQRLDIGLILELERQQFEQDQALEPIPELVLACQPES